MRILRFLFSRFFIRLLFIAALFAAIIFLCFYIHSLLPVAAAFALSYALSVAAAAHVLHGQKSADFSCAFLTLIILLPIAGAVFYFIYIFKKRSYISKPDYSPADCESFEYLSDGAQFLEELTSYIEGAKRRVLLEFYIIAKGEIWKGVCAALEKALLRGVEVKVIYDGFGSGMRAPVKDFKALKKAGAKIKVFNKPAPIPLSRLNFRDHRKIAVVDDAVFLGGVNIADEYAHLTYPHGFWKDGGAVFFGGVAERFARIFLAAFYGGRRDSGGQNKSKQSLDGGGESKHKFIVLADDPERVGGVCEDVLAARIYAAEKRVHIFTPYLCAGEKLCDALTFAAGRGVDVKIIIPAVPDKKLTYAITCAYAEELARGGVKVFAYSPGFIHFKGAICDDECVLGSYNLDFRSLRLNYECGVWGRGELTKCLSRDFENTLDVCGRFTGAKRKLPAAILKLLAPLM